MKTVVSMKFSDLTWLA
uniref:Uncharacterized protein n=1 Tax=Arundo donax TaxID=35708 RepID=A0A0A8Y8F6_ARUDO